jgi:predicted pyridoxine 5'-phosphate oxidase superfamily flavin-nucleotide-binding protein
MAEPTHARFHEGELAVQRQAGVEDVAAKVGRNINPSIPNELAEFLRLQPFVVVAALDEAGQVWASLLVGGAGFADVADDRRIVLSAGFATGDPLASSFEVPSRIGILAIEFDTRTRIRLNGVAGSTTNGLLVDVDEAFRNCPKFIQRRTPGQPPQPDLQPGAMRSGPALNLRQIASVGRADTFFIASVHAERGADASHRGGRPGFVKVSGDGRRLWFPDYSGNRMFQTLGNIAADPRVGLLFVDFELGSSLQVTGLARIVWEADTETWPGAERVVEVDVDAVRERERAIPRGWRLVEPSPLNPPLSR